MAVNSRQHELDFFSNDKKSSAGQKIIFLYRRRRRRPKNMRDQFWDLVLKERTFDS